MSYFAKCLAGAALILGGCCAGAALAQNTPAAAQEPPPKADPGVTAQSNCISDSGGFKKINETPVYTIELANRCEQRLKCEVFVYIVSAKGPVHGHATMILAPKSRGTHSKDTYVLKVKMLGGITQSERECRVE
jgi:hypothetical protein